MKVIILRHGKTGANEMGQYNGLTDHPLSIEGREGARRAGVLSNVSRVYVSPLLRARQTAKICFPNAEQTVMDELREIDFGDFEGRTADGMRDDPAYRAWVDGGCVDACPNGESISGFSERTCKAFESLVRDAIRNNAENLIIVAHGGTAMAVMSRFTKKGGSFFDWMAPNCGGWCAEIDGRTWNEEKKLKAYSSFTKIPIDAGADSSI